MLDKQFDTKIAEDPALRRQLPFGQYEFVDVKFTASGTDTQINYTTLKPEDPNSVRWIDVTPNAVFTGSDATGFVYRSQDPNRQPHGIGYLNLRSNVAGYTTRLMLFLERN